MTSTIVEQVRVTEFNGKKFTFSFLDEQDKGLALNYTKGDKSKQIGDITVIKPHFKSPNHPVWYEIAVYDEEFKNMRILARIQVDDL